MKTLRMLQIAIAALLFAAVMGCSDSPVTTGGQKSEVINRPESSADNKLTLYVRLKPGRSYEFNSYNTGFFKIIGIDIKNLSVSEESARPQGDCQDLLVYSGTKADQAFDCHSRGFAVRKITVENTGSRMIDLQVTLTGVRLNNDPAIE
ncbi:MAG: hypothetical protein JNJ56_03000 [Ignavibacteria bacterium]|nr:hypothetical protein [Ignavibacteria bacterium]